MDHAVRAQAMHERGYLTPAIDEALLAMRDADESTLQAMRAIVGISLERKGLFAAAIPHLDKVLDADPNHARALAHRGMAHDRLYRKKAAQADLSRSVDLDPDYELAWQELGYVCYDLSDEAGLAAAFENLSRISRVPGVLARLRGKRRMSNDAKDDAIADLQLGCNGGDAMSAFLLDEAGFKFESGAQWAGWALDRQKRNMPDDAIAAYKKALAAGFNDPDREAKVARNLAEQLNKQGKSDDALQVVSALTDRKPEDGAAWLVRAGIDQASASFEKAHKLSAKGATQAWVRHLLSVNRKDEALAACNEFVAVDVDNLSAHHLLGDVMMACERPDDAKKAWLAAEALGDADAGRKRVAAFGPELGMDFFMAALKLLDNRRREEAAAEFDTAIDLFRGETRAPGDEAHRYLAKSLYNSSFLREMKVADEILEPNVREAVELDPTYTDAMLSLGNMCLRTDRIPEGLKWFSKAGEMDPAAGQGWYYRARHFYGQADYAQTALDATKAFEAYSRRNQQQFAADAIMLCGEANENLGKLHDAKRNYDTAYDWGHPTGCAKGDGIRNRIAVQEPDSAEAEAILIKLIESVEESKYPWIHSEPFDALVDKSPKAVKLSAKLQEDETLSKDETTWLVGFLQS